MLCKSFNIKKGLENITLHALNIVSNLNLHQLVCVSDKEMMKSTGISMIHISKGNSMVET